MNLLYEKLTTGKTAIGSHISLNDPIITEMIGDVGFDYLWIDTEHTSISLECLQLHLVAARAAGVSAIVRVPEVTQVSAKRVLEMGPDGIIFPQVNSYELAEIAVRACMYPPLGNRGFGPRRAIRFGNIPLSDYLKEADHKVLKLLQFENIEALKDLKKILTLDFDAIILGPCDLASSMGHMNDWHNPEVEKVVDEFFIMAHNAGKKVGVSFGACDSEEMMHYKKRGVDMISIAADSDYLVQGAKATLKTMNEVFK